MRKLFDQQGWRIVLSTLWQGDHFEEVDAVERASAQQIDLSFSRSLLFSFEEGGTLGELS